MAAAAANAAQMAKKHQIMTTAHLLQQPISNGVAKVSIPEVEVNEELKAEILVVEEIHNA